jgi:hypothetical protein
VYGIGVQLWMTYPERERTDWLTRALVPVLSVLAGGVAYLWAGATTSTPACATGGGVSNSTDIGLAVLWLAVPALVALRARRRTPTGAHTAVLIVVSLFLAALTVFLGYQFWWSGHGCYT